MTDFQALLDRYPTRETVQSMIGDRLHHKGAAYDTYYCPFHHDRHASLVVGERWIVCKAGCAINGKEFGDLLDFIKEYYQLHTWPQVEVQLTGAFPAPPTRDIPTKAVKPQRLLNWSDVEKGEWQRQQAIPYFTSQGMKESSVTAHHLGRYASWGNHLIINSVDHVFHAPRYTLPDIAFGRVRNIELRLDEAEALRCFRLLPHNLVETVAEEIQSKLHLVPTEMDLVYEFYGAKYLRVPGGVKKNLIGNVERVMKRITHEGQLGWFSPDMPYVLLHEGLKKAWVVEDCCDDEFYYPSISAKGAAGLAAIPGVTEIIVVQDRDADSKRPDGTLHNPGRAYAQRAVELSGRRLGHGIRIIVPPDGYKAGDDLVLGNCIHEWLGANGVTPVRRSA